MFGYFLLIVNIIHVVKVQMHRRRQPDNLFVDITNESAQLPTGTWLQSNLVAFKERTSQCAYLYLDVKTGPKGRTSL